jgi:protein-S-isoprenylcysteine O-methyltransferase Ste14
LVVVPVAAGFAACWRDVDISKDGADLIAAGALMAALMLALFVQLATWRSRLDDRAVNHLESEAPTRRAVDEAAAHSLVGGITSIVATGVVVAAGILGPNRLVSGLTCLLAVYLGLLILVIFHMAWVAYWSLTDDEIRREDDRLLTRPPQT